jgi:large repetitive protein
METASRLSDQRFRGGPVPPYVEQNLVTLESGPISTQDPWLPSGATTTVGNNVQAYADLDVLNGYVGTTKDLYGMTTSANTFDHLYNLTYVPPLIRVRARLRSCSSSMT